MDSSEKLVEQQHVTPATTTTKVSTGDEEKNTSNPGHSSTTPALSFETKPTPFLFPFTQTTPPPTTPPPTTPPTTTTPPTPTPPPTSPPSPPPPPTSPSNKNSVSKEKDEDETPLNTKSEDVKETTLNDDNILFSRMEIYKNFENEKLQKRRIYREVIFEEYLDEEEEELYKNFESITDNEANKMIEEALIFSLSEMSKLFNGFIVPSICIRFSSLKKYITFHDPKVPRVHKEVCKWKANSALEFSGSTFSIPSHDIFRVFGALPLCTNSTWSVFNSSPGGRAFYKKGTNTLLGSIGVSGDDPKIDDKVALNTIQRMDFETSPTLSVVVNEPSPYIELSGRYYLYASFLNEKDKKTILKIYDKLERRDLCEHEYQTKEYFFSRGESNNPMAICPKCLKLKPSIIQF